VVSAFAAFYGGLPLPWMLGPMIGVTVAALAGVRLRGPVRLRQIVVPVIGVMIGSSVTPAVLAALGDWVWTVLLLVPFLGVTAGISFVFYRRAGGYDPVTAYFSAMPGGLNDMVLIGGQMGGDERKIALAHATRILSVVSVVALAYLALFGVRSNGGGTGWVAMTEPGVVDWAVLAACAVLGVPLGTALRIPAAQIVGPLVLSAATHAGGLIHVAPPSVLVIVAQVVMGTAIGARFVGTRLFEVRRDLVLALGSTVLMLAVAIGFAEAVAAMTGVAPSQVFLAFSPGGVTEMGLLALAIGADVAYVSVTHIVRIFMVILVAPLVFGRLPVHPRSRE
jgi:membrane AbrB-like protein